MHPAAKGLVPALFLLGSLSGCARAVGKAAQAEAPIITAEMVDGIYGDRELVGRLMSDPAILQGTHDLSSATARGVIDELKNGGGLKLRAEFGHELAPIISESLDRSFEGALDDETRERARAFALSISEATAQGFVRGMGDELSRQVGDDAPSLEIEKLARAASRGAALGLQDAVRETEERRRAGNAQPGDVLGIASEAANTGSRMLMVLPMLLAALAAIVSGAAVWMLFRLHRDLRKLLGQRSEPPEGPPGGGHAYAGE